MAEAPDHHIEIPAPATAVGRRIEAAGGELYVVGGWLRDRLRGEDTNDVDMATSLTSTEVREAICELAPVYDLGEKFGTVGIRLGGYTFEITTFRSDEYTPGSRHPRVSPVEGIIEDLARRDFTINALALSVAPEPGRILDPFGGQADIEGGLIRTPGPPAERMEEDPLRMIRAVRFAAQLGYDIDRELMEVLRVKAPLLEHISAERRRDELEKVLVSPNPDPGIRTLIDTGLMDHVSPEVSALKGVEQPKAYHRADVLEHTLLTLTYLEPDPLLRRAALFHDLGKPGAKVTEPKTMFPEHEKLGESLTREAMRRLRYSNEDVQKTAFLVRRHMRPIHYDRTWSDAAVRRLIRDCTLMKDDEVMVPLDAVIELARADILAGSLETARPNLAMLEELGKKIEEVKGGHDIERSRSPLDGRELMALFGREAGPWLREVKDHLTMLVLEGEIGQDDREEAARRAREFLKGAG